MKQATLRKEFRQRRQSLIEQDQRKARENLAQRVCQLNCFKYANRLAFYLANDAEIDPSLCLAIAQSAHKQCYLPALKPLNPKQLIFLRHKHDSILTTNRYGIAEPQLAKAYCSPAWTLDVIFLPLVAFNQQCHRVGMGGGYYDRTLAFKRTACKKAPLLIGLAHHCQLTEELTPNQWDVPLDAVVTDQNIFLKPPNTSTLD